MGRAIACASLIAFVSLGASGQAPTASSGFEVASIRLNKTGLPRRGSMEFSKGGERFTATNMPLGPLLLTAYNITVRQLSVPASFPDDRYDIAARADHPLGPDEMRHMIQELLVDRFKLVVHREIKEVPVYALVIGKGGQKLHESQERESDASPRTPSRAGGTEPGSGHLIFKNESMSDFAWALSRTADIGDRLVVDQTGLTGNYDFELMFGRDNEPTAGADGRAPATPQLPSIFSALQDQLGLKLEPKKASVEFLEIVHVEKPSDN
ncbi:MAG TPA: TIGR03435 family protein [Bryobacteraceae bacterium]|nr:TIGR03435 family protein [Bryobacteraceae bacterium]